MASYMRKLLALAATAALLFTLVAAMPGDSSAANLTGGQYTYVVNGEEVTFAVDPISRKDGLLLPAEVFQKFGITLEGALKSSFTLSRYGVTATAAVGSPVVKVGLDAVALPSSPVRLNGRLFIPSDILKYFGVDYVLDGSYLTMRDLSSGTPAFKNVPEGELGTLKLGRTFSNSVKSDSQIYLNSEFTLLSEDLLTATGYNLSYGNRVRLLSLLQTNTLVMVKLSNSSFKSGAMPTAGLYLVDQNRRQYEVASVFDLGEGLVTGKVAPAADRTGVLVFPRLGVNPGIVTMYYDAQGSSLGVFTNP